MIIKIGKQIRARIAVTILLLVALASCASREVLMDSNEMTAFATGYAAAWSNHEPAAFALFYAENGSLTVNDGDPAIGRDAIEQKARGFMTAFPDMVVRLVEVRPAGGHVIFQWHWTGTNSGPGGTGNAVDLKGYEEWTIDADGLILESLGHYDDAEYQRQLRASTR